MAKVVECEQQARGHWRFAGVDDNAAGTRNAKLLEESLQRIGRWQFGAQAIACDGHVAIEQRA